MPVTIENIGNTSLDGATLGQWVKTETIRIAEEALIEEVAQGFDSQPVVITDGTPQRDYAQVKPFGRIKFARRAQLADVVLWTLDELRKISPVVSGRYVSSHEPLINGRPFRGTSAKHS